MPGDYGCWIRAPKRFALYARDNFACIYCKRTNKDGAVLTLDHLMPREAGGSNETVNLVTCCRSCNSSRGAVILALKQRGFELTERRIWFHWNQQLIRRGISTEGMADKIRRQRQRKINRTEGWRLFRKFKPGQPRKE